MVYAGDLVLQKPKIGGLKRENAICAAIRCQILEKYTTSIITSITISMIIMYSSSTS